MVLMESARYAVKDVLPLLQLQKLPGYHDQRGQPKKDSKANYASSYVNNI